MNVKQFAVTILCICNAVVLMAFDNLADDHWDMYSVAMRGFVFILIVLNVACVFYNMLNIVRDESRSEYFK